MRTAAAGSLGLILSLGAVLAMQAGAQETPPQDTPTMSQEEEQAEPAADEPAPAGPATYTLDPDSSFLAVVVYNDDNRWTPVTGHDHVMRASTFQGEVVWDEQDASACAVKISFPASALQVDPPGARERIGLDPDGSIGDGQKSTVVKNMLGKHVLGADVFPELSFVSTACEGTVGYVNVRGTLTVRGVSKAISVPMKVTIGPESFQATSTFDLGHADFGMKPFTYGPGTPRNMEKLTFVVDVQGGVK